VFQTLAVAAQEKPSALASKEGESSLLNVSIITEQPPEVDILLGNQGNLSFASQIRLERFPDGFRKDTKFPARFGAFEEVPIVVQPQSNVLVPVWSSQAQPTEDKFERVQQASSEPPAEASLAEDDGWQIEFQPTILLPLRLDGSASVTGNIGTIDVGNIQLPTQSLDNLVNVGDELEGIDLDLLDNATLPEDFLIQSIEFDLGLRDILRLDRALRLSGRLEAWNDNIGLIFDGQYTKVDQSGQAEIGPLTLVTEGGSFSTGSAEIDTELDVWQGIFDFAFSYRFGSPRVNRHNLVEEGLSGLWFEPIVGVRLSLLGNDFTLDPGPDTGFEDFYAEPLLGGRLGYQVLRNLTLGLRGDVSGFGIEGASNLTWNLLVGLDWLFADNISLRAAYRIYNLDFDTEEDGLDYELEFQEQGLWLGFAFAL
jgi:hypothetical protein